MSLIDESWVKLQDGLYLEEYELKIGEKTYLRRKLHSIDGYCFKDMSDMVWDEELQKEREPNDEERTYYTYISLASGYLNYTIEQLNASFVSVKREDYMIVA